MSDAPLVILHLGLGSFHRAHQAVYLQRLIERGGTRWQIAGGNLRPDMADTVTALQAQRGAYTLETVSPAGDRHYERIESIREVIGHEPSLTRLIDVGADDGTRIISFTVTEGGYYLDSRNRLTTGYAELDADLAGRTRSTIYGALAAILGERMRRGSGAVTLLNCDNLRSNGERFRAGFVDFLSRRDESALLAWVHANTTCPNNMVDRITPRPSPEVAERVLSVTGWNDQAPVMAERFTQWVIEDWFCNGRPAWEAVGVEMVASVLPYEEAKIRILNASHSCLAWAGSLLGQRYIHESVWVPAIREMAFDYVSDDVIPCLRSSEGGSPIDLESYRDVVLERFSNPHLRDTNERVAMDSYSKIPSFLGPTFRECLARGASIAKTAKLLALFFEFLGRWHVGTLPFAYHDTGMDAASVRAMFETSDPLGVYCRDPILWGPLAGDERVATAVRAAHGEVRAFLQEHGLE